MIAGKSSQDDIKYLQANFEIEKARNSTLHLAEQARFLLTLEQDLANNKSVPNLVNWIKQNKLEDVRIQSLLGKFK
ncbi:hypothetical protein [Candidatus Marithrix sp. Canyon 246]|uniref:hypothetical protein n=1 Tax=Candidatus Marithrix sp. Canyon 246 TaxID=1827136 RepID=UPI00084A1870|nr:hypothetical protein [Candidatus Marithrix sp. Canyon 246]